MNESCCFGRNPFLLVLFLCLFALVTIVEAQSFAEFPSHGNPLNQFGTLRANDAIPVSSGMIGSLLPRIPNLELGFMYSFGSNLRTGRFTMDYVRPFSLSSDSVLFGEAHAEVWDFWNRSPVSGIASPDITPIKSSSTNRIDLSFGGGYRTMLGANTFLGVNGFYDASRQGGSGIWDTSSLSTDWYSSGGVGVEFAANLVGDDAIDLNCNWYGNLFNKDVIINAFRNQGSSFDVEAGYSHALFNQALDLRLKVIGYQFDVGNPVRGWRSGADLTTRDGVFTLRYEYGQDRINGYYNTLGGFVNVGFQVENVFKGENPFTMPEPVFKSPRDLKRLLGLKVKRNWGQPKNVRSVFNTIWTASTLYSQSMAPGVGIIIATLGWTPFTEIATANRLIVTVQNPPPGPNGARLGPFPYKGNVAEPPTLFIYLPAGTNQVVVTDPMWTRGQGFIGSWDGFAGIAPINQAGNTADWTPGLITAEWQE